MVRRGAALGHKIMPVDVQHTAAAIAAVTVAAALGPHVAAGREAAIEVHDTDGHLHACAGGGGGGGG